MFYKRFFKKLFIYTFVCFATPLFGQDSLKQKDTFKIDPPLKLYPLLWQQTSAEYRALCYQAFNIATQRITELTKEKHNEKLAIITDIDETILDNSGLIAQTEKTGKEINSSEWMQWINKPQPPTVPGAVDFLKYAASKGITIFYISNREAKGLQLTVSLLQKLKLPDADTSHLMFLSKDFSKEPRRQYVMKDYNVVMLLGDNLSDFSQIFDDKLINERLTATDTVKDEWGKKFIVLPNSVYGDWESALYDYKDINDKEKLMKLKALLKGIDDNK